MGSHLTEICFLINFDPNCSNPTFADCNSKSILKVPIGLVQINFRFVPNSNTPNLDYYQDVVPCQGGLQWNK